MPYVEVNGLSLWYEVRGEGSPLVLLHGGWADIHEWDRNVDALAEAFRVYRYDRRGCGRSEPKEVPQSAELWVEDLRGFLEALGLAPAYLCGISYGGLTVLEFILKFPQMCRAAVLVSATGHGFEPEGEYYVGFPRRLEDLPSIKVPTLVVHGRQDPYFPQEQGEALARGIPGAELVMLDAGHSLQEERPEEFNRAVLSFLRRQEGRA